MSAINAEAPDRFRQAASYYTSGRPDYPTRLIERVAAMVGLERGHRVIDLGTGPGFLALAFAEHAGSVIGIDPSSEMLAAARANAARSGAVVSWLQGRATDLEPSFGPARLVTIGRALHWMDPVDTLRRLDGVVEAEGAVVLFADRAPPVAANAWRAVFEAVRERYAVEDRRQDPVRGPGRPDGASRYDQLLLDSSFPVIERVAVLERRVTPLARLVDRALSYGATWVGAGPGVVEALAAELRQALAPFAVEGLIHEVVEGQATLARRV